MIHNITWAHYLEGVAIASGIYYCFVGVRYYSADLIGFLSGKSKNQPKPVSAIAFQSDEFSEKEVAKQNDAFMPNDDEDEFAEVEHLIGRLNTVIADASRKEAKPQELKSYLHLVLQEYPNVKNSPLRSSVNELIASECEKYGAVTLSENEVDPLWDTE